MAPTQEVNRAQAEHEGDGLRAGPLAGIRILDLTRVVMGPLATQTLADQGADVVIVEPNTRDTNRVMGPGPHPDLSGIALNLLRNKRSISIDLKSTDGRAALERLVPTCDVVVSTMRPQVLTELALDYASLSALKPDLVYCQAQGFSLTESRAEEPAYDDIIQAASGVADVMQRATGDPTLIPTILADKVCGLVIAQAITAGLLERERTGRGRHIEVPMHQAMTAFMLTEHGAGGISEPPTAQTGLPPIGYPRILSPHRRPHPTSDGLVHMLPYLPKHYAALFADAGVPDADSDPRYADQRSAIANSDSLYQDIRAIAPSRTTQEWLDYSRSVGIPATAVATLDELVAELPIVDHPVAGRYRLIPTMANFHGTALTVTHHAPLSGQDTDEVLGELPGASTTPTEEVDP
ncbi:crotonobetainyl-CoA:carnitine CoA-transferase CaiB-like acyl-CoA transferase [Ilumatobacter fluminis]|uniref:Crotonobetainyl-CoA:carnitine CoA-transferase CaiB-like acyl-CoA transferase n=1 Tax=Ilumatobacter fluminis TaxID=467091 RepID=A0A4R7HZA1_9ACTN|nr:CoA transferase [Ilumatobacter fluminis]TDT15869.1 crotonobetainyl-CoA:carnitine CoA-transferase CaiB-like acyl-CoA transferase [Ilumatobacter fluminis]